MHTYKTLSVLLSLKLSSAVRLVILVLSILMAGCVEIATPIIETTPITVPSVSATDQVGIQPLAVDGSSFYYYADGNRILLTPSLKWVSVKFASDNPATQSAALQDSITGPLDQSRRVPNPELILLPLQEGLTTEQLIRGINSLRADSASFLQVNPVFQTADAEMAITDEFIATFPAGKSQKEIDAINSSHGVEIVQPVVGQENTFILRVPPSAKVDSLSMANLYQESGAATNAAPNFVRIVN